jgi:hypothetical protein
VPLDDPLILCEVVSDTTAVTDPEKVSGTDKLSKNVLLPELDNVRIKLKEDEEVLEVVVDHVIEGKEV